jgi:hypothetical protein
VRVIVTELTQTLIQAHLKVATDRTPPPRFPVISVIERGSRDRNSVRQRLPPCSTHKKSLFAKLGNLCASH